MFEHQFIGLEKKGVEVEGRRLEYHTAGEGEPLILLHGCPYFWRHFLRVLKETGNVQLITLDMPGYGTSKHLKDDTTLEKYCHTIHQLAKELGFKKFSLMGQSQGAIIALIYASYYPNEIDKLVLASPPFSLYGSRGARTMELIFRVALKSKMLFKVLRRIHKSRPYNRWSMKSAFHEFNPIIFEEIIMPSAVDCNESIVIQTTLNMLQIDPWPFLEKVNNQTLIITGDQDPVITAEKAYEVGNKLAKSEVKIIPKAKHGIMIERPEEYSYLVADFLKS